MSSKDYRFMLWVREPDGGWELRQTSGQRTSIEEETGTLPLNMMWRMVSLWDGVLAESLVRV